MGKNHGKHGKKTELAKKTSMFRRLQNELDKKAISEKKHKTEWFIRSI